MTELLASPVVGWKSLRLSRRAPGVLCSPFNGTPWRPGKATTAGCDSSVLDADGDHHRSPAVSCTCGIYAYFDRGLAEGVAAVTGEWAVVARVEGWGRVIEHERGWRAEHARVVEIWALDTPLTRELLASDDGWPVHREDPVLWTAWQNLGYSVGVMAWDRTPGANRAPHLKVVLAAEVVHGDPRALAYCVDQMNRRLRMPDV